MVVATWECSWSPEFQRKAREIILAESVGKDGLGNLSALSHWGSTGSLACCLPLPTAKTNPDHSSNPSPAPFSEILTLGGTEK